MTQKKHTYPTTELSAKIDEIFTLEHSISSGEITVDDMLNHFPGIIYLLDKGDLSLRKMNRQGIAFLELDAELLEKMGDGDYSDFIHDESRQRGFPRLRAMGAEGTPNRILAEFIHVRYRDGWRWMLAVAKHFEPLDCLLCTCIPLEETETPIFARIMGRQTFREANSERFASLTERENEIFGEIASGMTNSEIARQLHVSVNTVKTHRKKINMKLEIRDVSDVMRYAAAFDLIKF